MVCFRYFSLGFSFKKSFITSTTGGRRLVELFFDDSRNDFEQTKDTGAGLVVIGGVSCSEGSNPSTLDIGWTFFHINLL